MSRNRSFLAAQKVFNRIWDLPQVPPKGERDRWYVWIARVGSWIVIGAAWFVGLVLGIFYVLPTLLRLAAGTW